MFPGLQSVDIDDISELTPAVRTAFEVDGPSVVSIECSPDEIPPFAAFLGNPAAQQPHPTREIHSNVTARA
jgi:acetolactate synthase-1/2/3 large subunit